MEEKMDEEKKWEVSRGDFAAEVKKEGALAAPMVAVTVSQYLLQLSSLVMVGHLGQLSLSSVAIATSLTNVTGFSLISGLSSGLETLCGQAFGGQEYEKVGTYTYTAVISLTLVCPPISLLWILMHKFLSLIGQDPIISLHARDYSLWLVPALFGFAILKPLTRYCQTQSSVVPMLFMSFLVLAFHVPTCWALVYGLGIGMRGAAMSFSLSTWLYVILMGLYVNYSSLFERTRIVFSRDCFHGVGDFFRLAIPSALMICLKWWAVELLTVLSGLLPNPKLETSVLSICLTISTLHFTIPYGIGAAASTRVSNELGRGKAEAARLAAWAAMSLAITEALITTTILFCCRYILGYAFTNDKQIVHYIALIAPFICLSVFMDSLQAVLSGIARGSGWQHIGAYINLASFYLVGIPVAVILAFVFHLNGKGLWIGIVIGSTVQATLLSLVAIFTDWKNQAIKARERVSVKISSVANSEPN